MANQYVNKVQYVEGGTPRTLIDLTSDTITASALMQGYTAHDASGAPITGTATGGSMVIRDEADSHGGTIRHITAGTVVTGTTTIIENGSYDVAQYADAVVNVPAPAPSLQSKTATPTESQQTVQPDSGYDGLSSVTVGAISSTYVGSGITRRSSTDLTASGSTVTAPSGYYASSASKSVASGTATPAASISATGATVSTGTNTLTLSKTVSNTPQVTAGYVSSGTAGNSSVSLTASVTTQAAQTIHPSTSDQTIAASRYLTGAQTVKAVTTANLTAANIKQGVTVTIGDSTDADCVASVTGTYSGGGSSGLVYETGTWTPTEDEWQTDIYFTGTYSILPFCVMLYDTGSTAPSTSSIMYWGIHNWYSLDGSAYVTSTSTTYARVSYSYTNSSGQGASGQFMTGLSGNLNTDMSQFLQLDHFRPYTAQTSRYYRSGRTYKWIAVWAPTS